MRTRQFNVLLILSFVVALAALIQDFRFDVSLAHGRAAALGVEQNFASIDVALAAWRGAQAGYVATGQGPAFWIRRAGERSSAIEATIIQLQTTTASPEARAQYDQATSALGDLNGLDTRAREFALGDRRFEASDVIFTDAIGPLQRLTDALTSARAAERQVSEARLVGIRWMRIGLNLLTVACLVGAAWLLRRQTTKAELDAANARAANDTHAHEGIVSAARPAPAAPPAALPSPVNLSAAAELCVDLGRVMDGKDVPALLARIAPLLGAKGIVLWVADATGSFLRPSLTLGYPDRVVERLGVLQADGDNVTSLAFRSMRSQTVNGAVPTALGAIAVPLVTAAGCVGVLAAEVSRARPDLDTLAVARMIAAQFAGLVAPDPLPARTAQN